MIILVSIDMMWLGLIMQNFYQTHFHEINKLAESQTLIFNIPAAIATWALITLGSMLFVLPKTLNSPYNATFLWGACFGFIAYGVYDLTNFSTIAAFSGQLALYDLAWGTVLNGILACVIKKLNSIL